MEAEAVGLILQGVAAGRWELASSEVVYAELARMPDAVRRGRVLRLTPGPKGCIVVQEAELSRVGDLLSMGFKSMDAFHIACAESAQCDVLLTTDDRLHQRAKRNKAKLAVTVANPLSWLEERAGL